LNKPTQGTNQIANEGKPIENPPFQGASSTNPYRPPVGTTSFNDAPLVPEMSEELPAVFEER